MQRAAAAKAGSSLGSAPSFLAAVELEEIHAGQQYLLFHLHLLRHLEGWQPLNLVAVVVGQAGQMIRCLGLRNTILVTNLEQILRLIRRWGIGCGLDSRSSSSWHSATRCYLGSWSSSWSSSTARSFSFQVSRNTLFGWSTSIRNARVKILTVIRYSTARSGLLKLALKALITCSRSKPISIIF